MSEVWIFGAIGAFHFEHLLIDMSGPPAIAVPSRSRPVRLAATCATSGVSGRCGGDSSSIWRRTSSSGWSTRRASCVSTAKAGLVTAMFTDIEGFTALTERSDPREVLRLLDACAAIVTDTVIEHGGMVDKLMGDGVFALFNVPLDLADHVERAVAAARAVVAATDAYRETPLAAKLALRAHPRQHRVRNGDCWRRRRRHDARFHRARQRREHRFAARRLEQGVQHFGLHRPERGTAALDANSVEHLGVVKLRGTDTEIDVFTIAGKRSTARNAASPASTNGSAPGRRDADVV